MSLEDETPIWEASPSQILNLPALIMGVILAVILTILGALFLLPVTGPLFFAIAAAVWLVCLLPWAVKAINTRFFRYRLTSQRLKIAYGVFSRHTDVMELYRVKDMTIRQPFILRVFGLSNITMNTSDRTNPEIEINAIRKGEQVADTIRKYVENLRDQKRVREVDFEGNGEGDEFDTDL